jgi:glycosyltransferase involved in cell wall biosynthesis
VRVSVVIRSYKRPSALKQLIGILRRQRYSDFEIVVLEQSADPTLVRDIESLGDDRLRVFVSEPKGPPAARNAAIRHSTGDVVLLIDDDDLPLGDDWLRDHARNYEDPLCMGVAGRLVRDPDHKEGPRFPKLVRAVAMTHTFFKDTRMMAHGTLRKADIDFLPGSNVSVRRSLLERIGGWDEGIPMNEEQSFAIKFHRQKRDGEYLVFDPVPEVWRRTDIPGGLDRRSGDDWSRRELEAWFFYYRHVVGHYFPWRYRVFLPFFVARGLQRVLFWVWDPDNSHRSSGERVRASLGLLAALPSIVSSQRFPVGAVLRVPDLLDSNGERRPK